MKDYLREKEAASDSGRELFGLVRESIDVPLVPEKNEWTIAADPERLIRNFAFEDIEGRNWFLKELLDDETKSGHNGKIIIGDKKQFRFEMGSRIVVSDGKSWNKSFFVGRL